MFPEKKTICRVSLNSEPIKIKQADSIKKSPLAVNLIFYKLHRNIRVVSEGLEFNVDSSLDDINWTVRKQPHFQLCCVTTAEQLSHHLHRLSTNCSVLKFQPTTV